MKLTLKNPESKLKPSQKICTHANNNEPLPNLLNHFEDLSICSNFFSPCFLEKKCHVLTRGLNP
jgi:hypothetical protein